MLALIHLSAFFAGGFVLGYLVATVVQLWRGS